MQLALIHWLDWTACSRAGYIRAVLESGLQNGQGWKHLSNIVCLGNSPAKKQFESLAENYSAKCGIIKTNPSEEQDLASATFFQTDD